MSFDNKSEVIAYWLEKSNEAIEGAKCDLNDRRYSFAVSRAYYACFYALSAVLLKEDEKFTKHSGVRGALHRSLVKTGRISKDIGRFYDRLFESRQRADYQELVTFEQEQVEMMFSDAVSFVGKMRDLLAEPDNNQ